MRFVPGQTFVMGSNHHYPEERPAREVVVEPFWIDRAPVTNDAFGDFVEATGYKTVAERIPDPSEYPHAAPELLVAGSAVFISPQVPVPLDHESRWWHYVAGANWRQPEGPGSSLAGRAQHPVVHVAFEDAVAYAAWARKAIPTEEEWELAARGGSIGTSFAWGDELTPNGRFMANTWHGRFPWENTGADGFEGTSPVGSFPPNGFDLVDMIGNVWEWTASGAPPVASRTSPPCCAPAPASAGRAQRVIKGGSFLCSPDYCARYRPSARQLLDADSTTSHVGFRCVSRQST
jgi:formylglycine-generating enzyme required for sulfatase activity